MAAPGVVVEVLRAAEHEHAQRRAAGALAAAGLGVGDRVVLCAPSSGALLAAVLGATRRGIVPVVLHPTLTPTERRALVADADPQLVVDGPDAVAALGMGTPVELAPVPRCRPMLYTSGTTGRPKGVWSGILDDDAARLLADEEAQLWGFAADDVHLVCSPLYHSAPIRFAAGTLLAGGDVVVLDRFDAGTFVSVAAELRPTTAFLVPAHLQRLFTLDDAGGGDRAAALDVSSFRLVAHAGAPCPAPLKRAAIDAFPRGSVWEFYGSTEGQFTVCSTEEWEARPGTVGRARPRRRLIVEPDPEEGRSDDGGVIWCEAPGYARFEYWRDPVRTAAAWRDDAFTVGDVGRLDADGYLFLDGRRGDLIISGGVNVYPAEVEEVLATCPGVREVAVFAVADERWGQRVCAAVAGDVDPALLRAHARSRLAPYKRPKDVYVVAELPRSSMGKVRRTTLAADLGLHGDRPR